jgi:hypothetical protein
MSGFFASQRKGRETAQGFGPRCADANLSARTLNAEHLRRILSKYASYYNGVRTHVSLGKDAPCRRPIECIRSLADDTIITRESEFSEATGRRRRRSIEPPPPSYA